ncbi:MAG: GNAT family N-acetyltransferase [Planctomycetes bacterium]|nr:GNAT family N-acetyltransferase [Planctomycetota bacterium]
MHVLRIQQLDRLLPYHEQWDRLADGCIFRSWAWLSTWWKHYQSLRPAQSLNVLLVFNPEQGDTEQGDPEHGKSDPEHLVAVLPCYLDTSLTRGKVLRLLGDGEVCSDHLSLLVDPANAQPVSQALAKHLVLQGKEWDLIDFPTLDEQDEAMRLLASALRSHDCHVSRQAGPNSWSIALPGSWEEFLMLLSKSHRKQLRRLEKRALNTGLCVWHLAETQQDFDIAWTILVDLHQRRRISLGEPGCFASQRWSDFHRDVAQQLLQSGRLRLSWLELGGQPAAAEYNLAGHQTTFAYQGGIDPDRLEEGAGQLSLIYTIRHAIDEGHLAFDLLRGDEPYKPHWRATPRPTVDFQIVPPRNSARWRYQAWNCLRGAGRLTRKFANS